MTTTTGPKGGMFCGLCGARMYYDAERNIWRCPNCSSPGYTYHTYVW